MGDDGKCHHGSGQARCGNLIAKDFLIFKVSLAKLFGTMCVVL
jgi:hypothetical protein